MHFVHRESELVNRSHVMQFGWRTRLAGDSHPITLKSKLGMIPFLPQAQVEIRINTTRREADEKIGFFAAFFVQLLWTECVDVERSRRDFREGLSSGVWSGCGKNCVFWAIKLVADESNTTQSSLSNTATSLLGSSVTLFLTTLLETLNKSYTIKRRQCDKIIEFLWPFIIRGWHNLFNSRAFFGSENKQKILLIPRSEFLMANFRVENNVEVSDRSNKEMNFFRA